MKYKVEVAYILWRRNTVAGLKQFLDTSDLDAVLLVAMSSNSQQLERLTIRWGPNSPLTLELTRQLQEFRVYLLREELLNAKQVAVDTFFGRS